MDKLITIILQLVFFVLVSPLLSGLITKMKNNIRMRKGQSIFQPYYNIMKLFSKGEVVSGTASWIFKITPFVVVSSVLTAALFIPVFIAPNGTNCIGDFLALVFILSIGRFFLALSGLDTGSAFGGMGASREMFIASFVEPVLCVVIFSVSLQFGSTDISAFSGMHAVSISSIAAVGALFLVMIAETSRIPVDNQETHLELTMVHEAMVLEYSGRSLAFIELGAYIKQMILFFLIAQIIFPIEPFMAAGASQAVLWFSWYLTRILIIIIGVVLVEVSVAKMRLFRVADFLGFAFVLAVISAICAILRI